MMDHVLPAPLKKLGIEAADECVPAAAPFITCSQHTIPVEIIDCERLLLPIGQSETVEQSLLLFN